MPPVRYLSHDVVLEPDQWQLRIGDALLTPEPKVFELLCYLMRHRGRLVSKGELLDALWSGDVVGESVLTRCISCARKALGDDTRTPRFIRTFHGRGYEYIAPVHEVSSLNPRAAPVMSPTVEETATARPEPTERGFVGRQAEARSLRDAVRRVGAQQQDFMLVTGEAGIGKSRLLGEATRDSPPGVEIHWGYSAPVEGAPQFLVWQQCFRSIVRQRTMKTVLRAFGDSSSEARRLVLCTGRGRLDDNLGWDSPSQRFRAFDAIAQGLAELAAQRGLVLVLDDLQFADLGSLLLLDYLIRQRTTGLLILGAMRDAEPLADRARAEVLEKIRAACPAELALSGLTPDEVRQFVELRLGRERAGLGELLHARTGGNPFYLSVLALGQEGIHAGEALLPRAIRQAVSHRLAVLDAHCVALLRLAAVRGRDIEVVSLSRSADLPIERCLRLLAEGVAARVIVGVGSNEYRFVHDLLREVLYAELSVEQRARAHLAVGHALEAIQEYQHPRHAAMLAHHFMQGAHLGGASRALDLSIRAGAYALRNFAYEDAIEQFRRASRLLSLATDKDPATECAVLLDLGLAQISAGQREAGRGALNLAAAKARELGAAAELAGVALSLVPGLFAIEVGGYDPLLVELLREALDQVGEDNRRLRALLLARLALALYWSDTFNERVAICAEAAQLAELTGADDVRASVATAQALALLRPSNIDERRRQTEMAVELCGRAGDHHGLLLNRLHRATLLLEQGDIAASAFEVEAFQRLALEVNQPQALWIAQALRACRLLLEGRLAEVEAIAAECLQTGHRVQDHNALQTFGVHITLVRIEQGRAAEMLDALRTFAASYPRTVAWRAIYTFALHSAGERAACAAEFQSSKVNRFALPEDLVWQISMAWFSEVCHALGDAEAAATLYERFAASSGRSVVIGYGIACLGSVDRYLALLCATLDRRDAAERHFQQALEMNRRLGGTLPLAHTLFDYALFLLGREPGRRDFALEQLREAESLARERDLPVLRRRIEQVAL